MWEISPENLDSAMKRAGINQSQLADLVGVKQPSIGRLLSGETKTTRVLDQIAEVLGTTAEHLKGEQADASALARQLGMRMIPDVDIAYSLGGGSIVQDYVTEKKVPFRQDWLDRATRGRPSDVFLTRGDGDSMLPTILDGDDVLVNRAENVIDRQDRIWALGYGELAQIKRVRRLPSGMFQLNSDNPVVSPIEASEDELHVVGRVIWIGRKM